MNEREINAPIPVTIVTGFLGCGKTTLLNYILTERHGEKIAVIENEFGEVGIDNELLLSGDEQIVEMNNGCICCTVRGDLIRILGELADKRAAGSLQFDRVLIETTGLATPGPVAQTFFLDEEVSRRYLLDAVVTLVDAVHAMRQLDEHDQAQEQVGFADRLLLSKTDLVDAEQIETLSQRLHAINPRADIQAVYFGQTPLAALLDIRGFNLNAVLEIAPGFLAGGHPHNHHAHRHDNRISSCVFRSELPFDNHKLQDFLRAIARVYGADLLRYKGVLSIDGLPYRVIIQGVHELMGGSAGADWADGEERGSTFVFIGRNLPREIIEQGLRQSQVKDFE
ncbi:CobW family GTP-binding protein [Propionivibrio limicola]|uniref:CobW family GTP-binding protein n=1 Tax=Propionivibrio limicola TaxID=167645 RepID=UPI001291D19C|nr:GTP-binding protein [Propionivibrio limicola]